MRSDLYVRICLFGGIVCNGGCIFIECTHLRYNQSIFLTMKAKKDEEISVDCYC